MTTPVELHPTRCAICQTENNATELYAANFDYSAFNTDIFSARRLPDVIHYRLVKCNTCGLVRSDPVVEASVLARLYTRSSFTYSEEVQDLKYTYGRYLPGLAAHNVKKDALLEIGSGNGFFLGEALKQGYASVIGVEPSQDAVAKAPPDIRPHLICDVMRPGLFEANQFDVICLFQVFDHIAEPGNLLDECRHILRPGGLILFLNHNVEALSARLMKEKSPIIDIEHTYLYSFSTLSRLASVHGFQIKEKGPVYNRYKLAYLARLVPLPHRLKSVVLQMLQRGRVGQLRLSVPLGNLYLIAQKPV
jgi:SAM-dependent methyltransferase